MVNAIRGLLADEGDHFACFALKCCLNTENAGSNGFLAICIGKHGSTAALAYIQLNGTGLYTETASYKVLQIFAAACKHFVSKAVSAYGIIIFADEGSLIIMDSFGNADNHIAVFLKAVVYLGKESFCIKGCLRKIDQKRIVACVFPRQSACCGEPSCVTSHDLYDGNGFFLIYIGIQGDLTDCGSHISGSASEARGVISVDKIVINSLRLANNADITACHGCIPGKLAYSIHGVIAANIEEPADIHFFKFTEKLRVYRIL